MNFFQWLFTKSHEDPKNRETATNNRLEAFCDGIFAISITLLILEIKIPEAETITSASELKKQLLHQWPSWSAFLLTFFILFVAWVNHHNMLHQINKTSNPFIYANGFLMLTVVVYPFTTGLLGRFLDTEFSRFPIVLYCTINFIHNLAWLAVVYAMLYPKDLSINLSHRKRLKRALGLTLFGCLYNLVITILTFRYPLVGMVAVIVPWILYAILGTRVPRFR